MRLLTSILFLWTASLLADESVERSSISSHVRGSKAEYLVIPVAVEPEARAKGYFRDPMWGIRIESVICDGTPVVAKRSYAILYEADFRIFVPSTDTLVYRLPFYEFLTATKFDTNKVEYELVEYTMPPDIGEIVVCYRVVYPDGSASKLMKATSVDHNYFGLERSEPHKPNKE